MLKRCRAIVPPLCAVVTLLLFSRAPALAGDAPALYPLYEGILQWHGSGPQRVVIVIEKQQTTTDGILRAEGIEHYRVTSQWRSLRVQLNVDLRSLRAEIVELPEPQDGAQETAADEPIVATLSGDLRAIVNDVEGMPASHPDFVLRARSSRAAAAMARHKSGRLPRRMPPRA